MSPFSPLGYLVSFELGLLAGWAFFTHRPGMTTRWRVLLGLYLYLLAAATVIGGWYLSPY